MAAVRRQVLLLRAVLLMLLLLLSATQQYVSHTADLLVCVVCHVSMVLQYGQLGQGL